MSDTVEVNIPVLIECVLTEGWGGERWSVINVSDQREGHALGDIGIYEFDAHSNFHETLINAVIKTLEEIGEFERKEHLYSVEVKIQTGGSQLGIASRHFYGYQLSS